MNRIGRRKLATTPPEWIVHDEPIACPYLRGQTACLPLRLPARPLNGEEFSQRLQAGDRRQGVVLYRPNCPSCRACEAIRIEANRFEPNKTQRRIFRRGGAMLKTSIGPPTATAEKVDLYNRHKEERGLQMNNERIDALGYDQFLVDTCTDTIEVSYRHQGKLVGVAITDRAADALSAVYAFYDPDYAWLSPGVYSILAQLSLCRRWELSYLYLGLYVGGCRAMRYKANYLPHERLVDGAWRRFDRPIRP